MVTKKECVFCGLEIEPGTGKMVVDAAGAVVFYCSSKCEKNSGLNRRSRKVKWTTEYRREKGIRVEHLKGLKKSSKEKEAEKPKGDKKGKAENKTSKKAPKVKKTSKKGKS
jgi:large subunit ribosomal protein L24e